MWSRSARNIFFNVFFFSPMPPHVLVDFVVLLPGHGRSVTDFWVWDAYETQLRCPDDVSGDIGGCSAREALKSKFYHPSQTIVTAGILPFREKSHGTAGNRARDLMISSQRLWPLDHEAGHIFQCRRTNIRMNTSTVFSLNRVSIVLHTCRGSDFDAFSGITLCIFITFSSYLYALLSFM